MNLTQEQQDKREARIAKAKRHQAYAAEQLAKIDFSKESRTRQNAIRWMVEGIVSNHFYNEEKMTMKEIKFESETKEIVEGFKHTTRILSIKIGWKDTFIFDQHWTIFIGRNGGVSTYVYNSKTRKTKQLTGKFDVIHSGYSKSLY